MTEETTDLLESKKLEEVDLESNDSDGEKQIFMNRLRILGFAKNIKFWTFLELIYNCFIGFFFFWPYIFFSVISGIGYIVSKNFNKKQISLYLILEVVKLICQIFILIFIDSTANKVISSIMLILGIVYINTILRFYRNLCAISERDLQTLRNGWSPRIVYFVY